MITMFRIIAAILIIGTGAIMSSVDPFKDSPQVNYIIGMTVGFLVCICLIMEK